jgi:CubicO group peptidase (beta-lactamase class C family)
MTSGASLLSAVPESVGVSSARLARIPLALQALVDAGQLPGAVVAITRRGRLIFHEAVGFLTPERTEAMRGDALFAIASMTKPIAGVAALMLLEEGKLTLSDPVEAFLPSLGKRVVAVLDDSGRIKATEPARRSISILDLMRHTSGLPYGGRGNSAVHAMYPASSNAAGAGMDAAAFLDRLAAAPLLHQPGTVWEYGLSIDVIGLIVETLSGKSLGAFLEERLFGPLGMVDTSFQVPADKSGRVAKALANDPDTGAPQAVPDRTKALRFECGGGGLASTTLDYMKFAQMLLNGGVLGDVRILGPATVAAMASNRLTPEIDNRMTALDPNLEGWGFGLTVAVTERPSVLLGGAGSFSWTGAYGTLWWADPAEDLAVVFMSQVPGEQRRRYRTLVTGLVYQALVD